MVRKQFERWVAHGWGTNSEICDFEKQDSCLQIGTKRKSIDQNTFKGRSRNKITTQLQSVAEKRGSGGEMGISDGREREKDEKGEVRGRERERVRKTQFKYQLQREMTQS
jgi:hypothetical protein